MNEHAPNSPPGLMQRLAAGDRDAFAEIYHGYVHELFGYARRNVRRREDAEEIIQEVFESLWQRHQELGHITSPRYYLYSAVRYKIIRYFSRQDVRKRYEEHYRLFEAMYDTMPDNEHHPEWLTLQIFKTLEGLPDRCQEAMKLRLTENLSNGEIAARMEVNKDTVENYMVKALSHLRKLRHKLLNIG